MSEKPRSKTLATVFYRRDKPQTEQLNGGTITIDGDVYTFTVPAGASASDVNLADMVGLYFDIVDVHGNPAKIDNVAQVIIGLWPWFEHVSDPASGTGVIVAVVGSSGNGYGMTRENASGTLQYSNKKIVASAVSLLTDGGAAASSNGAWFSHNSTAESTPWQSWVVPFTDAGRGSSDYEARDNGGLAAQNQGAQMTGQLRLFIGAFRLGTAGGDAGDHRCGHTPGLIWDPRSYPVRR